MLVFKGVRFSSWAICWFRSRCIRRSFDKPMHQCTQTKFDLHEIDDFSKDEMYMLRKMRDLFATVAI